MRNRQNGLIDWFMSQYRRRPKPLWMVICADVLLLGLSLVVFALFHHVLPRSQASLGLTSSRDSASGDRSAIASVYDDTDDADASEAPAVSFELESLNETQDDADTGDAYEGEDEEDAAVEAAAISGRKVGDVFDTQPVDYAEKFASKFTSGEVIQSSSGYQSANVNITLNRHQTDKATFYVADIYLRDVSSLVTAFAKNQYGKGIRNWASDINKEIGGIIAINGDYYGGRDDGIVIRNGELYRADTYPDRDVCVLFWDGTMETYGSGKFDAQAAISNGAYQAWNFGPRLLDSSGKAKTRFNSDVGPTNPRTVLGYFEPGHYCFVVVDGRSSASSGLTLTELAALMQQLGCTRAYNMDGGNTSVMVVGDKVVNNPSGGGRPTTDIIAIVDL